MRNTVFIDTSAGTDANRGADFAVDGLERAVRVDGGVTM